MQNDFLPREEDELVKWASHCATIAMVNATTIGLTVAQVQDLNTKTQAFIASRQSVADKKKSAAAAVEDKDVKKKAVIAIARQFNRTVQGKTGVDNALKTDLGFKVRVPHPKPVAPVNPEKLTVEEVWDSPTILRWKNGGNTAGTLYEIQAMFGTAAAWTIIGTTDKLSFRHIAAVSGEKTLYRVRALRREEYSGYSNVATAYPAGGNSILLQKAA